MNNSHEHAKVISFPEGIPGFTNDKEFLIYHGETEPVSYRLESCACKDLSFTLMTPDSYDLYYDLTLSENEETLLDATQEDELAVFFMLLKDEQKKDLGVKANLHGPVIININKKKGIQKVIGRNEAVIL